MSSPETTSPDHPIRRRYERPRDSAALTEELREVLRRGVTCQ